MSCVAIIPARGGSRRIPHKNSRLFHGLPIIGYSITTVHESGLFDKIIVSTDDEKIAAIANEYYCDVVMRPAELSEDNIGTQEVMAWTLAQLKPYDYACCVYATTPLMSAADLRRGHDLLLARPWLDYAFSAGYVPFLHDAAQFYWGTVDAFVCGRQLFAERSVLVPIAPERDCDINEGPDWDRAEAMYADLHRAAA